jgi:hypothetical protein
LLGPGAQAMADVVARDHQVSPIITFPPHDNVHMRMFRVPVIDRGPVQFCPKVTLHFLHQVAGKRAEIGHLQRVIGRYHETEMMSVTLAPLGKGSSAAVLPIAAEGSPCLLTPSRWR